MIEILILYLIRNRELTMYGIQKAIKEVFAAYASPGFGALNPALKKLEKSGFVISRRIMSDGGKQSGYYIATHEGNAELKRLLLSDITENPVQFFSNASVKLSCASVLSEKERAELFEKIKNKTFEHKYTAENILNNEYTSLTGFQTAVLKNTINEYNNLIALTENMENENGSNSQ